MAKISVVIPVLNSATTLEACLDSLRRQDLDPAGLEVIFVDNGSTDGSQALLESSPFTVLREPRRGGCFALNQGIRHATGEVIAFTHADCVVATDWARRLRDAFSDPRIVGVGGSVVSTECRTFAQRYARSRADRYQRGNVAVEALMTRFGNQCPTDDEPLPWINVVNGAFRRSALERAGLFDEQFEAEYEIDLSWRIFLNGGELRAAPDAVVDHRYRAGLRALWRRQFVIAQKSAAYHARYGTVYRTWFLVPYREPIAMIALAVRSLREALRGPLFAEPARYGWVDLAQLSAFCAGSIVGRFRLGRRARRRLRETAQALPARLVERHGRSILIDVARGRVLGLNPTAARVYRLAREGRPDSEIARILSEDSGEGLREPRTQVLADVRRFLREMPLVTGERA